MSVTKFFGIILLTIGVYLMFNLYKSSLPMIYGSKVKAKVIGTESVKSKRFTYLYYPVIEFIYKNKVRKITDKSSDIDKNTPNVELNIYYSEKYGISRGFSAVNVIFSIIALAFIFFGFVVLFKSKQKI